MCFVLFSSIVLVILIYLLFFVVFYKSVSLLEMMSCYECGFDPKSNTRLVFSYRFFLISILFIIFDVEISLMVLAPFFLFSGVGIFVFYFFIFVLIMGLVYEYYYGSLDWLHYCSDIVFKT